jgi:alkylation response protein AidB-like acyl-CoA dehydrogenase
MERTLFEPEHRDFREAFVAWLERDVVESYPQWERDGRIPRELFHAAGRHGFLGMSVPEEHGGAGAADYRFNAAIAEETHGRGLGSLGIAFAVQNDICLPYFLEFGSPEQHERWLPGLATGELVAAIAMTEPGTGSDLAAMRTRAVRDGEEYLISGAKTFISNGLNAELVIVAATTDPAQGHRGVTLFVVEADTPGFARGEQIEKLGLHAQDTAELFFDEARVPLANRLGEEGAGFRMLMANLAQERLSIAVGAVASAETAIAQTVEYVGTRRAFGNPLSALQTARFALAELRTEVDVARIFVDRCVEALCAGRLAAEDAAKAKWWTTELQGRVIDRCLQLHGGYGYTLEYPIGRAYLDARVTRIYGGANEVMKEIVARSMGLGAG